MARYQGHDESRAALWLVAGGLTAALVAGLLGALAALDVMTPDGLPANPKPPEADALRTFPEPRLQAAPAEDLRSLREAEAELLSRYEWIDREAGVARIPIERAARLIVEQGLPVSRPATRSATAPATRRGR
jgi:hypothetical protein